MKWCFNCRNRPYINIDKNQQKWFTIKANCLNILHKFIKLGGDGRVLFELGVIVEFAAGDYFFNVAERAQIIERVLRSDYHIGALALGDGACHVAETRKLRAPCRGGVEGEGIDTPTNLWK